MDLFTLILYLFVGSIAGVKAENWDLVVAFANKLEFLHANGAVAQDSVTHFGQPSAVAYDADAGRMFISDSSHPNNSIFQLDNNKAFKPLVPKLNGTVPGLAFHSELQKLFWTTGSRGEIGSIDIGGKDPKIAIVISFKNGDSPFGIAVDGCKDGKMYWTNNNWKRPTIGQSHIDGSNPTDLVATQLNEPLGIAFDQDAKRVYWTDDTAGAYFRIESCDVDGEDRRMIVESTYHQPYALAVSADTVFYTDWSYNSVWSVPNDGHTHEPTQMKKFSSSDSLPRGLATRGSNKCRPAKHDADGSEESTLPNDDATTVISREPPADYCLHGGALREGRCVCRAGTEGPRCEREACFNYCLNAGKCSVGDDGNPTCACKHGFEGTRCEVKKCRDDFCVNGGCVLDSAGSPSCRCDSGFRGMRCQLNETAAAAAAASGSYQTGENGNGTAPEHSASLCSAVDHSQLHTVALVGFASLSAVLAVAVAVLTRKVVVLRRRPRIRKQIIVKKNVTPLTSRPPAGDTCEITIENCCNMNICETPCFEPQLRSSKTSSRKEEKVDLLGNMEEEPSCSSGDHSQLY